MNIDWSKAQEGYDYHIQIFGRGAFYRMEDGRYVQPGGGYIAIADLPHHTSIINERPKPWTGEGLPPVGTVCEYQTWVNREWKQTKVLAHHLGFAVHSWSIDGDDMEVDAAPPQDFRPILTPEQIAEEAQQAAITVIETRIMARMGDLNVRNLAEDLHALLQEMAVKP